jgi:hypothetical protein
MDWNAVTAVLNSLPATYRRSGPTFAAWQNSLAAGITRGTGGVDTVSAQTTFANSSGNWLNVWGRMLGVIRNASESDVAYKDRISETMLAWRGTVPGIESYVLEAMGIPATVTEKFPAVGWSLNLPPGMPLSAAQLKALPGDLAFVRPAGVPYTAKQINGGLFLKTGNFLGATRFQGSWLQPYSILGGLNIPSSTNNTVPTLPTTWLTDPTINPGLA